MENHQNRDIYQILGIDPNHKSPRSDANYDLRYGSSSLIDESIVNDPDAPSGNIIDNYSNYPRDHYDYWRFFRILTFTGIAVVLIVVGHKLIGSISFPSSSPKIETEEFFTPEISHPQVIEAPAVSPYGPFRDKAEVIRFIENHFNEGGYENSSDIAETVVTDYGSPKEFSKSEYAERTRTHNSRHGIVGYEHNIDRNSVSASRTADGGVEVSFSQTYDMTTRDDWGIDHTSQYDCNSKFRINSDKKITYIWERARKINEW